MSSAFSVRERHADDIEPLLELLRIVHDTHGYPANPGFLRADFLAGPDDLGAWVAEAGDRLVGHVALMPPRGASAPIWLAATGRPADEIAVIGRLFSRAPGAGSALLSQAVAAARAQGLAPVLETERDSPAVGFYLRRGWRIVGEAEQHWRPPSVTVAVMVAD